MFVDSSADLVICKSSPILVKYYTHDWSCKYQHRIGERSDFTQFIQSSII